MYSLRPMRVSLVTVLRTAGVLPGLLKAVLAIQYSPVDKFKVHRCVTYAHTRGGSRKIWKRGCRPRAQRVRKFCQLRFIYSLKLLESTRANIADCESERMGKRLSLRRLLVSSIQAECNSTCSGQCSFSHTGESVSTACLLFTLFFSEMRMGTRNFHVSNPVP